MFTCLHLIVILCVFQILSAFASFPRSKLLLTREATRVINGLLHRSGETFIARRALDTCDPGYLPCSDGNGCCPEGEYCGEWGGKLGCCPNGSTCTANPGQQCDYEGYTPCAGQDFCCPSGDTCSVDSTGGPQCSSSGEATASFSDGSGFSTPTLVTSVIAATTPAVTVAASSKTAGTGSAFTSLPNQLTGGISKATLDMTMIGIVVIAVYAIW